uniref:Putative E3 ubiquitin-protein ligase LIN ARM-like domain-containing protein n=1 Tax=Zea mays TaxID=4577 RepID=A0A804R6I7_MAIZE
MVELLLHGSRAELIVEAMDVLLKYLRSLPAEEQAPIAVLLMCLDALVEPNRNNTYREEAIKTITHSLRCCLSEDTAVPSTRRALLLLGGQFNFSGDLHAEDWMLEHAGFVDHSQATTATSDAVVHDQETIPGGVVQVPRLPRCRPGGGVPDDGLVEVISEKVDIWALGCLLTWNLKLLSGGLVADFHSIGLVHLCFDSHTPRIKGACIRGTLQLLLPNAEAAVYIAGSVCAAFVANIDGHSDKTVTFNGRMLRF